MTSVSVGVLGNDAATPTLESNPWQKGRYRSWHVRRYGGERLRELASDNKELLTYGCTHEQLDHMCRDVGREEWMAEAEEEEDIED